MNPKHLTSILLALLALTTTPSTAAPQWWQQIYTPNSNSQITLKDENNNDLTAINNPTADSVRSNANTNTQPPTVVITGGEVNRWSMYYKDRAAGLP